MCVGGYVKNKVYATRVTGVEDLKAHIRNVVTIINQHMLGYTWEELNILHVTRGTHIEVQWMYEKTEEYAH